MVLATPTRANFQNFSSNSVFRFMVCMRLLGFFQVGELHKVHGAFFHLYIDAAEVKADDAQGKLDDAAKKQKNAKPRSHLLNVVFRWGQRSCCKIILRL